MKTTTRLSAPSEGRVAGRYDYEIREIPHLDAPRRAGTYPGEVSGRFVWNDVFRFWYATQPPESLRTPQGEPALTDTSPLPGKREPVSQQPHGTAGESPALFTLDTPPRYAGRTYTDWPRNYVHKQFHTQVVERVERQRDEAIKDAQEHYRSLQRLQRERDAAVLEFQEMAAVYERMKKIFKPKT